MDQRASQTGPNDKGSVSVQADFPMGGGRTGGLIRVFDWSLTPLGSIESWPRSLRSIVQMMVQQRHAMCIFWGPALSMLYNDSYGPMLGKREAGAMGRPFADVWADVWQDVKPFADQALSGQGTFSEDLRLIMTRNGYEEETFWTFSYSPIYDDDGRIAGLINVAVETTASVRGRSTQQEIQRELLHRIKNSLAVTSAVVTATLRHASSLTEARTEVERRISALSEAQALVTQSERVDIRTIIASAMKAHLDGEDRLVMTGPPIALPPHQAVGLSLAVYELATNALKYGALSNTDGRVRVAWEHTDGQFRFAWQELAGPAVIAPTRRGFGSRLTNQIVAAYFAGSGATTYEAGGVRFELTGTIEASTPSDRAAS